MELHTISGRRVALYPEAASVPLVVCHGGVEEEALLPACRALGCPPFTLAVIRDVDWMNELSPWPQPAGRADGASFGGGADAYLAELTERLLPALTALLPAPPADVSLCGYSLAGLFAVYAGFRCESFRGIASASGSLWYPGFAEYAETHAPSAAWQRAYLSVGDRESRGRNPVYASVGTCTVRLAERLREAGIATQYASNPGGHGKDVPLRMAKAVAGLLL